MIILIAYISHDVVVVHDIVDLRPLSRHRNVVLYSRLGPIKVAQDGASINYLCLRIKARGRPYIIVPWK
jgi:hypothetical protein